MPMMLQGSGVSRGIVIGAVRYAGGVTVAVNEYSVAEKDTGAEVTRFKRALAAARRKLKSVRGRIPRRTPADIRSFIDTHLLMLEDPALTDAVGELVRTRQCNAEWALLQQRDRVVGLFESMDDEYLRTRRDDVEYVVQLILDALAGAGQADEAPQPGEIVVAHILGPADIVQLHHAGATGFITETGGPLSHAVIVARSLGLPGIAGLHDARRLLRPGERVALDGERGLVIAEPDALTLDQFKSLQREDTKAKRALRGLRDAKAVTRDGKHIRLQANIELPEELRTVRNAGGADGIGLYRTEFLFLGRESPPDEDEQLAAYVRALDAMHGEPVTVRTLDLGADKTMPGLHQGDNPALGLRAIRLGLREPGWLSPQLRALMRAAARGPLQIMVPMVSNLTELRQFRQLMLEARADLERRRVRFDPQPRVGIMIEVPAAALSAHLLVRHVDFLSIGTNDLIQYSLAIDRTNDEVNYLYNPLHPAVLRLISLTLQAGRRAGVPVTLCGEMAGDTTYTRLLLGLGLETFSMHPANLLEVKRAVRDCDTEQAGRLTRKLLRCGDPLRAEELLSQLNG